MQAHGGHARSALAPVAFIAAAALALVLVGGFGYVAQRALGPHDQAPIVASGSTPVERLHSALAQAHELYPYMTVNVRAYSPSGVYLRISWKPLSFVGPGYGREVARRAEDAREGTVALLQAMARAEPGVDTFSAFEDRLVMPVWTRAQILGAGDPADYRDFERFSRFQLEAART